MSLVQRLVDKHFGVVDGELVVGQVPITQIASAGTPLFVYDGTVLDRVLARLREVLPDRVEVFYSVKANPSHAILERFVRHGCGLEIASGGELYRALAAGCPPDRIVFAGPGKSEREIREFIEAGGGEIHVESVNEARRLGSLCEELDKSMCAAVRVNPSSEAQGGAMRMGGKPAPFGVDEEAMESVIEVLQSSSRVRVSGVHIFAGTQILDAEILGAQYRKCIEIARRVAHIANVELRTVDFGGGLGIPYFQGDDELDVVRYGAQVHEIVDGLESALFDTARLMIEPGRYLVGEAGVYVTQVMDVKTSRGKKFIVVDGGMNHHLAASGNLGQVIKRNFPIAVLNRIDETPEEKVDVVGPLCTPLDTLARNVELPRVAVGDLVGVFQSGAYARTASPVEFLSHPSPPEVLVQEGVMTPIRRRGTYDDLLADRL